MLVVFRDVLHSFGGRRGRRPLAIDQRAMTKKKGNKEELKKGNKNTPKKERKKGENVRHDQHMVVRFHHLQEKACPHQCVAAEEARGGEADGSGSGGANTSFCICRPPVTRVRSTPSPCKLKLRSALRVVYFIFLIKKKTQIEKHGNGG